MKIIDKIKKSLRQLIKEYKQAQLLKEKYQHILLGRIFSVGQNYTFILAECLFGDKKDFLVLVDHHIRAGKKSLYPDLMIIKGKRVLAIIEVKLDLGWFDDSNDQLEKLKKDYNFPKTISFKVNGKKKDFDVNKNIKKIFFVATRANNHGRYKGVKKKLELAGFNVVSCLRENHHPNRRDFKLKWIDEDMKQNFEAISKTFRWLK